VEALEDRLVPSSYNINFTASSETYPGYVNDTGLAYGSRGGGLTFGWSSNMTGAARDRNAANAPDERYDSLIHVGSSTWSIAAPNGSYTVHVAVGDPSYADVVSKLMVNGVLTITGSTSSSQHWLEGTTAVSVTNGLITVSEQAGSYDKIDYIDITSTGGPVIPAAPTGLTATPGNAQVALNWTASSAATSYNVYRSTSSGGEGGTPFKTGVTSTSYTDSGLSNGTRYYYQVTAVNSSGESSKSSEVSTTPQAPTLPAPWIDADIGSPGLAGSGSYLAGTFTLKGGGADIWNASDQFNYLYQPLTGDGTIIARVATEQNTNGWAKAGVMIRESLAANATDVFEAVTPGNGYAFQYRTATGASASWPGSSISGTAPEWVKLVRSGSTFTGYVSADGTNWTQAGSITVSMASNVYVGLALTAHDNTQLNTSTFDNVSVTGASVTIPAAPTNVVASAGNAQVSLTWNASAGATGYNIYRATTSGSETLLKSGVGTTSYADTGLTSGTTYYYQVTAVNSAGESARSSEASATPLASGSTYSTNFPLTENPISEGGVWVRGGTEGLDWTNPLTTGGHAVASTTPTPTRYSDDIAILKSSAVTFSANQYAQGTVYLAPGYTGNGGGHEVELLLHFSISAHDAHGYEILWGIPGYMAVVRWNGPVTSYTPIYDPGVGSIPVPRDGDVLRAEISGNIIKVFRNGTQVGPNIDVSSAGGTVWTSGQPGMGFWPVDGAIPGNYGWKSYQAGSLSPELLAGTPLTASHAPSLTQNQLDRVVAEAIALWAATGLNSTQMSALQHVQFVITDLPGGMLGEESGNTIYIDSNAAGYGWSLGNHVAPHKVDLLTVVSHELGHELGLPDLDTQSSPDNVMDGTLAPGVRRLPGPLHLPGPG
jgi:fibronectin type 3 domain-containing protein